jgi:hypothetical protein
MRCVRPHPIVAAWLFGLGTAVRLWQQGVFKLGRCAATVAYPEVNIIGALIIHCYPIDIAYSLSAHIRHCA